MPTTNRMKIQFDASHLMMASSCRCFAVVDSIIGAGIGSAIRGGHGCAFGQPASRPEGAPADAVRGYGLPAGDIVSWRDRHRVWEGKSVVVSVGQCVGRCRKKK